MRYPTPEELMLEYKRRNAYSELKKELANAYEELKGGLTNGMHPNHRRGVIAQLQFDYIYVSPALRILPEKLIGINVHGFEELFKTTVSNAFSYASKKVDKAVVRVGLRQYLSRSEKDMRWDIYLVMELEIPEARPAMEKYVDDVLALEADLIYCVFMEAIVYVSTGKTKISLAFRKDGLCVFEGFWSSKAGRFFVAKYNDYFLN